jgi:solute carrier family 25 protein 44
MRQDGVVGLYRGFVSSVFMYVPSSAVWWATYGWTKRTLVEVYHLNSYNERSIIQMGGIPLSPHQQDIIIQAIAGSIAGVAGVVVTHPMDVIKTRLQTVVHEPNEKLPGIRSAYQQLIAQEGYRGMTKGLAARVLQSTPVSVLLIVVYELVKKLSLKP